MGSAGALLAGASLLALLSGCATGEEDAVRRSADEFEAAITDQDGAAACALLAPVTRSELEQSSGTSCEKGVLEEVAPTDRATGRVQVFGTMAQVRYGGDTVFLTEFREGWRVFAAACEPRGAKPYDCKVKGG